MNEDTALLVGVGIGIGLAGCALAYHLVSQAPRKPSATRGEMTLITRDDEGRITEIVEKPVGTGSFMAPAPKQESEAR